MDLQNGMYRVITFGGLQIRRPDGSIAKMQTCRARALFVFLLLNRDRMVHRELLCSLLWPDLSEAKAKSQLRKTLWRIRSALSHSGRKCESGVVRISEHQIGLDQTQIEVDLWHFTDVMSSLELKSDNELDKSDARALLLAVSLNNDTFSTGIFDDWCLLEQEVMQRARLEALERIVGYHRAQECWEQAIRWAHEALKIDPVREHLHYTVMACHYSKGDRASAIRQYRLCEAVLDRELCISPSTELKELYQRITTGSCAMETL